MAIDFGRMARNVATGYLGQKLANTAANDELKATIIQRAGINFYENILPEFQKTEKNRKETYGKVTARYGRDVAEYMDQEGFTNYNEIVEMLGANDNFNETKLKAYLESVNAGTYESRRKGRVSDIQDREKLVMGNFDKNQIGSMTAKLLLKDDAIATDAGEATTIKPDTATETITTPSTQVGPVVTEAKTETREIPLPTYEDIFGSGLETKETTYLNMKREDQVAYKKLSNKQFMDQFINKELNIVELPQKYVDGYEALSDEEKKNWTLQSYAQERYFKEDFLPGEGLTYSDVVAEPSIVSAARYTINILKASNPDDPNIEIIKDDLRKRLGTNNLSEYGL
jgi:hypothetical protein